MFVRSAIACLGFLGLGALLVPAWAEPGTEPLISYQDGQITLEDLARLNPAFVTWLGLGTTPDQVEAVLEDMTMSVLAAREARVEGIADRPDIQAQIQSLLSREYMAKHMPKGDVVVSEAEIEARYQERKIDFQKPLRLHLGHVLVPTREEADLVVVGLKGGASLERLAAAQSLDPASEDRGGDLGWVVVDSLTPELAKEVKTMGPDEIRVVKSGFGYSVLQVLEHPGAEYKPYDEVRKEIYEELFTGKQQAKLQAIREKLWSKYDVALQPEAIVAAIRSQSGGGGEVAFSSAGDLEKDAPNLAFLSELYELGKVPARKLVHTSLVMNDGKRDLVISEVRTNCKCAQATVEPSRLAPGEVGRLTFRYDPNMLKEEGRVQKIVFFRSNGSQENQHIRVIAEVVRGPASDGGEDG